MNWKLFFIVIQSNDLAQCATPKYWYIRYAVSIFLCVYFSFVAPTLKQVKATIITNEIQRDEKCDTSGTQAQARDEERRTEERKTKNKIKINRKDWPLTREEKEFQTTKKYNSPEEKWNVQMKLWTNIKVISREKKTQEKRNLHKNTQSHFYSIYSRHFVD